MLTELPEKIASEIVYDGNPGYKWIATIDQDKHRWYTSQLIVFKAKTDGGQLYGFHHMDPATELQEDQERFDSDPVPVFIVNAVEVNYMSYERV